MGQPAARLSDMHVCPMFTGPVPHVGGPIVMTTVAMVAGMLPIAIGLGGDASFNRPMAITVIGGLITSTALTLVIVPAVFTYIDDLERWLAPKFRGVLAGDAAQSPPPGAATAASTVS